MGTISRSHMGELIVQYDKTNFVGGDYETFRYGMISFAFLIPRNTTISLSQFINLISKIYDCDSRVKEIISVIEKANNQQKSK